LHSTASSALLWWWLPSTLCRSRPLPPSTGSWLRSHRLLPGQCLLPGQRLLPSQRLLPRITSPGSAAIRCRLLSLPSLRNLPSPLLCCLSTQH